MEKKLHTESHQSTTEQPTETIQQSLNSTQDNPPLTNTKTTTPTTQIITKPLKTTHRKTLIATKKITTNNTPKTTDLTEAFQGGNRDLHTIHDPG
jgi:hypothetical protein